MEIVRSIQADMVCPHDQSEGPWETPIVRREDGEPIGVVLTLTKQDLSDLGLETESEETLFYNVADGRIFVTEEKNGC